MMAHAVQSQSREDHSVLLPHASWADYVRLLAVRGERAVPRITFLDGALEIMSPSRDHEWIKSTLACLLEVYLDENELSWSLFGSWTLQSPTSDAGAEPDECYVLGEDAGAPLPHLAIEVEWTPGRLDKLAVYARLKVGEVWYWRRGQIEAYVLRDGHYERGRRSAALPDVDLQELATCLTQPGQTSAITRAYRKALRARR